MNLLVAIPIGIMVALITSDMIQKHSPGDTLLRVLWTCSIISLIDQFIFQ